MKNAAMNTHVQVFVWTLFSTLLDVYLRVELLSILRNCQVVFPKWLYHFIIPLAMQEASKVSTFLPRLRGHFKLRHPRRCGFDLIFLMTNNVQHLFMCLLTICISSLEKHLFKSSPYSNWVVCFFLLTSSLLFIFQLPVPYQIYGLNINVWLKYLRQFF